MKCPNPKKEIDITSQHMIPNARICALSLGLFTHAACYLMSPVRNVLLSFQSAELASRAVNDSPDARTLALFMGNGQATNVRVTKAVNIATKIVKNNPAALCDIETVANIFCTLGSESRFLWHEVFRQPSCSSHSLTFIDDRAPSPLGTCHRDEYAVETDILHAGYVKDQGRAYPNNSRRYNGAFESAEYSYYQMQSCNAYVSLLPVDAEIPWIGAHRAIELEGMLASSDNVTAMGSLLVLGATALAAARSWCVQGEWVDASGTVDASILGNMTDWTTSIAAAGDMARVCHGVPVSFVERLWLSRVLMYSWISERALEVSDNISLQNIISTDHHTNLLPTGGASHKEDLQDKDLPKEILANVACVLVAGRAEALSVAASSLWPIDAAVARVVLLVADAWSAKSREDAMQRLIEHMPLAAEISQTILPTKHTDHTFVAAVSDALHGLVVAASSHKKATAILTHPRIDMEDYTPVEYTYAAVHYAQRSAAAPHAKDTTTEAFLDARLAAHMAADALPTGLVNSAFLRVLSVSDKDDAQFLGSKVRPGTFEDAVREVSGRIASLWEYSVYMQDDAFVEPSRAAFSPAIVGGLEWYTCYGRQALRAFNSEKISPVPKKSLSLKRAFEKLKKSRRPCETHTMGAYAAALFADIWMVTTIWEECVVHHECGMKAYKSLHKTFHRSLPKHPINYGLEAVVRVVEAYATLAKKPLRWKKTMLRALQSADIPCVNGSSECPLDAIENVAAIVRTCLVLDSFESWGTLEERLEAAFTKAYSAQKEDWKNFASGILDYGDIEKHASSSGMDEENDPLIYASQTEFERARSRNHVKEDERIRLVFLLASYMRWDRSNGDGESLGLSEMRHMLSAFGCSGKTVSFAVYAKMQICVHAWSHLCANNVKSSISAEQLKAIVGPFVMANAPNGTMIRTISEESFGFDMAALFTLLLSQNPRHPNFEQALGWDVELSDRARNLVQFYVDRYMPNQQHAERSIVDSEKQFSMIIGLSSAIKVVISAPEVTISQDLVSLNHAINGRLIPLPPLPEIGVKHRLERDDETKRCGFELTA